MDLGIDVDRLRKGDVIRHSEIREILGVDETSREFDKLRFRWTERIKEDLKKKGITCRLIGDDFHVLTDREATAFNARKFHAHRRGLRRRHELMMGVEARNLAREEKAAHDRQLLVMGSVVASMNKTMRTLPRTSSRPFAPPPPPPRQRKPLPTVRTSPAYFQPRA